MAYTADTQRYKGGASVAHLAAITGPIIPAALYLRFRSRDAFAAGEAAKALNFSTLMALAVFAAIAVHNLVPLVGFLGTLAMWAVPIVVVYFSLAGFRLARRGEPAHYPFRFKVVKADD